MKTLVILIFLALLVIAGVVISFAPLMTVTHYTSEPYTTTETYYVTETISENIPLTYEVVDTRLYQWWWRLSSDCTVTIKNTDTQAGFFRVEFNMVTQTTDISSSKTITKAAWRSIAPAKQEDITVRDEGAYLDSFTYTVTPPTKEITTSQQVPKTREIVQYREVTKTEKVTLLEYWTQ